ncbi:ArsR/SmtB family transcription factor [Actinoplanes teichomyceticus]|uniref:ArsR family transcriptional regulator n=1 Tax=Actinoplanes teichomyceticus TaxID=1867 RepID=A0A561W9F8_ACTTI|nr:metalloregulator ArsR/SmtB family transcription factor [Actinoplanes teichomyceticus]TWG20502.1 ArsR family transcriptional regulator [Actinoplanes teichomyceticus]GIF14011.1 putative transcriptional regulator, ArsR family protein [Actinoplanes teichomyceticus]
MVVGEGGEDGTDRVLHALSDATRRDILARVTRAGHSVSALAKLYPMSFAAVQKHVAVLERAELVTKERRGREQIVHGNPAALRSVVGGLLETYERIWRQRADRIAEILEEET